MTSRLKEVAEEIAEKYWDTPVLLGGIHEFEPVEVTVFFYFNRKPETDKDNWIADHVVTVPLEDASETADYTINGNEVVIWDTVGDLPKLDYMTNDERMKWYFSLSELERLQLAKVCGLFVGLSIAHPLTMMGNMQALRNFTKQIDDLSKKKKKGKRRGRGF